MSINIRLATEMDQEMLRQLLKNSDLNYKGATEDNNYFLVAEDWAGESKKIIAIAGIEKRGNYGFLRSLVLESNLWTGKSGLEFVTNVIKYAKELNFEELYLLTLPNSKFIFELLKFKTISLNEVPDEIKSSEHFQTSYQEKVVIMKNY